MVDVNASAVSFAPRSMANGTGAISPGLPPVGTAATDHFKSAEPPLMVYALAGAVPVWGALHNMQEGMSADSSLRPGLAVGVSLAGMAANVGACLAYAIGAHPLLATAGFLCSAATLTWLEAHIHRH